jgi:hypothetical protein
MPLDAHTFQNTGRKGVIQPRPVVKGGKTPVAAARLPVLLEGESKPKAIKPGNLLIVGSSVSF